MRQNKASGWSWTRAGVCAMAMMLCAGAAMAQDESASRGARAGEVSQDGIWRLESALPADVEAGEAWVRPMRGQVAFIDLELMRQNLRAAPMEFTPDAAHPLVITLPHPDGGFARFLVVNSPIMEPGLAAQFPEIQTFVGQGIEDPTATLRMDISPLGFRAQVLTPEGDWYVDPATRNRWEWVTSHYKRDLRRQIGAFKCEFGSEHAAEGEAFTPSGVRPVPTFSPTGLNRAGTVLRTFRAAVAATGEYTAFHGGTVALGQAAIVTAMNRVVGVYEREVSVRMVLVANNSNLVYTNASTDPYTNNSGSTMLSQNVSNVNTVIGSANYDIGHVFSTGGGGVAFLAVICTANKAGGVTGSPSPTGDAFWIDYVAHEMGHQFGGNHTFNSSTSSCGGGNRNASTAMEPGSGSTIQAYAGICGTDDLQSNSDAYFHSISFDEIIAHVNSRTCDVETATGNTVPSIPAQTSYAIPTGTPFNLTAVGVTDANGDSLTYCWEERALGASTTVTAADNGASPIVRSRNPSTSPTRTVPQLSNLLNNTFSTGERLPTVARASWPWRLTVRDNRAGGGGVQTSDINIQVVNTGAAFAVTSPNTNVLWSGTQTVTWNVAGTTAAPINAAAVNILLSTNGGNTFPTVLASNVPNTGSAVVTLPNITTTVARIRVEAVNNIFFDISNVNFRINPGVPATPSSVAASPATICPGEPVSLTATVGSGEVVDWFTGSCGGTLVGTGSPLVVTPSSNVTYFARARRTSDGQVSAACGSVSVTVGSLPTAPSGATTNRDNFCSSEGGSVVLTAVGGTGTTYRWFAGSCGGTPVGTGSSITIPAPTITTTYYVRTETSCGNSVCAQVTVDVTRSSDYDGSGFVDSDDFIVFVNDFELGCTGAGTPEPGCFGNADFDGSGFVDSDDFISFANSFSIGC